MECRHKLFYGKCYCQMHLDTDGREVSVSYHWSVFHQWMCVFTRAHTSKQHLTHIYNQFIHNKSCSSSCRYSKACTSVYACVHKMRRWFCVCVRTCEGDGHTLSSSASSVTTGQPTNTHVETPIQRLTSTQRYVCFATCVWRRRVMYVLFPVPGSITFLSRLKW